MTKFIKQAFTLIELLVVIAIIGILSGLIVITMNGVTQKATMAKTQVFANSLRNALLVNMVSEWKFDGTGVTDGNTIDTTYTQDTWGTNFGTITGTPKAYSGSNCVNGSCIFLNGSTDFISHPQVYFADYVPHTFSVWVKWGTTPPSGYNSPFGGNFGSGSSVWFSKSSKVFAIRSYPSGTEQTITGSNSTLVFDNNWHNVVWTIDSSRNAKFYLDGVENGSTTTIGAGTEMYYKNIGRGYSSSYSWNGYVDELRIFSDVIPTSQIKEQYYTGLNKLLADGGIAEEEYQKRIGELTTAER
jgi:prepilin-type N-terminal cleavage/methylation domain-containing protein